jgi:hypothetical protein
MIKTAMTYTVFGVSFYRGAHRLRFSNDLVSRLKTLQAMGDEDINIVELPAAMNKLQAVQWAQTSGSFNKPHEVALIEAFVEKNTKVETAEPKKRGRPRKNPVADVPVMPMPDAEDHSTEETAQSLEEAHEALAELANHNVDDTEELLNSIEDADELSDDELLAQLAAADEDQLESNVA